MNDLPVVIQRVRDLRERIAAARGRGERIALVPTMGALHEGHLSLVHLARARADCVVVSIYVNPTQFGPREDLAKYPRDLGADLAALAPLGVALVFAPEDRDMYSRGHSSMVEVKGLTEGLCGRSRPTHFRGVTTIVAKLFNQVRPDLAVFGEKDYQQLAVIRRMTRDLDFDVEIAAGPTVREHDGLAMSSRNSFLGAAERAAAPALHRALTAARRCWEAGERRAEVLIETARAIIDQHPELRIDYLELVDPDDLHSLSEPSSDRLEGPAHMALAVFAGSTRLIDNLRISDGV